MYGNLSHAQRSPEIAEIAATSASSASVPAPVLAPMEAAIDSHLAAESATTSHRTLPTTPDPRLFGQWADDADAITAAPRLDVRLPPALSGFQEHVDSYNALPVDDRDHQPRLQALNALDRSVYGWFRENSGPNLSAVPHAQDMRHLLDHSHGEFSNIANSLRQKNIDGTSQELPIDTSQMNPQQQADARKLWNSLSNQNGALHVSAEDPAFEARTYGNLAKIMQGQRGRQMLSLLDEGNSETHGVDIVSGDGHRTQEAGSCGADLTRRPARRGPVGLWEKAADKMNPHRHDAKYPPIDGSAASVAAAMDNVLDPDKRSQMKGVQLGNGRYKRGSGTGATVTMGPAKDPRSLDAAGNEVISPDFMVLAHELGHAAKMTTGTRANMEIDHMVPAGERANWAHRSEEVLNVHGIENPLRTEHGMQARGPYAQTLKAARNKEISEKVNQGLANPSLNEAQRSDLLKLARGRQNDLSDDTIYEAKLQSVDAELARHAQS